MLGWISPITTANDKIETMLRAADGVCVVHTKAMWSKIKMARKAQ